MTTRIASPAALALIALTASGCGSLQIGNPLSSGSVDTARYAAMSCAELNASMGKISKSVSDTAMARGRASKLDVPRWVLGGARVKSAVTARQTTRIERLQEEEQAIEGNRRQRC